MSKEELFECLIGLSQTNNLRDGIDIRKEEANIIVNEIERLNNIISKIETLVINHNCDTGDIYYKYNGRYLKSELKDRILELLELKGCDKE